MLLFAVIVYFGAIHFLLSRRIAFHYLTETLSNHITKRIYQRTTLAR
jgi:hypothetical protein